MLYLGYRVIGGAEDGSLVNSYTSWDRAVGGRGFTRGGGGREEGEDRAKDMNIIRCCTRLPMID